MVTPSPESDAFLWLDSYVVVEGSYLAVGDAARQPVYECDVHLL